MTGTRIIKEVERYVEWSCVLNCLCYHPYLVSMLFADLLSLHLIIFFTRVAAVDMLLWEDTRIVPCVMGNTVNME